MALAALVAYAGGATVAPVTTLLAGGALTWSLVRPPSARTARLVERLMVPLALVFVLRAVGSIFIWDGDVVVPVVDLLLLLMCSEGFRDPEALNDVRIYALSFALLLASTAYRPGLLFALAFLAYVVLGTMALPLGLLRRKAVRHGEAPVALGRGFVLGSVAVAGVTLVIAAAVFVTFPRVTRGWSGRGDVMATSVAGFSETISLGQHGATIRANPRIVLRVEFPDGLPRNPGSLHWRGRSYDRFDGVRWTRTDPDRSSAPPRRWYVQRWGDELVEQRIFGAPLDVRVLFALHPLVQVETASPIQPLFDTVGDVYYWGNAEPVYTAWSVRGRPPAEALRSPGTGFMPDRDQFLQLPELSDRVLALADSLTGGHATRYDKAAAVEAWLGSTFAYTRDLPATAAETSLEHFLFERRAGHCEYFSTAMVVLLRAAGVHARNVNGFLGGTWNQTGGYLAVSQNEAHSWVEVWFPNYGWVPFDPTPAGSAGSGGGEAWSWPGRFLVDGLQHRWSKWILDYSVENQVEVTAGLRRVLGQGASGPADGDGFGPSVPWWILGVLALVVAGVALGGYRPGPRYGAVSRSWTAFVDDVRRSGVALPPNPTPGMVLEAVSRARPAAARATAGLVSRYQEARFSTEAPSAGEVEGVATAAREARRRLRGAPKPTRTDAQPPA
jgi:transglutaminase-like putative cysteine protease